MGDVSRQRKGSRFAIRLSPNAAIEITKIETDQETKDEKTSKRLSNSNWRDTRKLNTRQLASILASASLVSQESTKEEETREASSALDSQLRFRSATTGSVEDKTRQEGEGEEEGEKKQEESSPVSGPTSESPTQDTGAVHVGGFSRSQEWREIIRSKLAKNTPNT